MTDPVLITRSDSVLTLTLNRPAARNALTDAMIDQLAIALHNAANNQADRIIVLRGAGDHFCAGADLIEAAAARADPTNNALRAANEKFGQLCTIISTHPKPIIACVQGSVIGGGIGLACAADIVLASSTTKLRMSEVTLGLIPAQILPMVMARTGPVIANRLAITGQAVGADAAKTFGLFDITYPDTEAGEASLASVITQLRSAAPGAIATTKALVRAAQSLTSAQYITHAADHFIASARSPEAEEGIAAFIARRPPSWSIAP